ncbi:MAG: FAD-dependent oxidoreductase [Tannerella sp.]|nr:FAD-dependent oxidoreductase [Tannerella sp.]
MNISLISKIFLCWMAVAVLGACRSAETAKEVDVCVYGGTAAGVMAAYSAKMMGKSVVLVEPTRHLGGMTTGGLGATDIGNKFAISGLSRDFYRRVGKHYGMFEGWTFEPSVASRVLQQYVDESQLDVMYQYRIVSAKKRGTAIETVTLKNAQSPETEPAIRIKAKQFIDCSYEGDLMARAGVSYTVGREANSVYGESWNGVYLPEYRAESSGTHQFPDGVDPYRVPGDPGSGLLWGVTDAALAPHGSGDQIVQTYNVRICLTDDPNNMIPITEPENYDPQRYELLVRLFEAQPKDWTVNQYFIWSIMPGNKTDINNRGGFSTDMIGANQAYPEADYDERKRIVKEHEDYTKGLLYFYITDPRVPGILKDFVARWGYPKDEYPDNNHWSPQLYIRESRRMIGDYVMTEANCVGKEVVTDTIGMAAYTMDSHNCQRIVIHKDGKDMVKNEGNVEIGGFGPYPISYRAILPKASECTNLLVPVCLSASHIAFGSIRMEPVFMVLGQSAGVAAAMAINNNTGVHDVDVTKLKELLRTNPLLDGSTPEILVDDSDVSQTESSGNWEVRTGNHYKIGYMYCSNTQKGTYVSFKPDVKVSGKYRVYFHCPHEAIRGEKPVRIAVDIRSASGMDEVAFDPRENQMEYGSSGSFSYWMDLGVYEFDAGQEGVIMVDGGKSRGEVFADAVVLVATNCS